MSGFQLPLYIDEDTLCMCVCVCLLFSDKVCLFFVRLICLLLTPDEIKLQPPCCQPLCSYKCVRDNKLSVCVCVQVSVCVCVHVLAKGRAEQTDLCV